MDSLTTEIFKILEKVEKEGDRALEFYTLKFDKVNLTSSGLFPVPREQMKRAFERISPNLKSALLLAKKRIEIYHKEELKNLNCGWSKNIEGISVGQRALPLSRVGIYVPGGRNCFPSTVLMTVIPAKVAGVAKIVVVSPPKNLKDEILAASYLAGVENLFGIGGPAAIAAMAYGTKTVPKVDKIFGPGNRYVTEAKRQLFGIVGIDALAGPSEIAVLADRSVNPKKIALNLLAQAEHDTQSRSVFLTQEKSLVPLVRKEIPKNYLSQIEFIYHKNLEVILDKINSLAPEHLWLAVKNPKRVLPSIKNAGAIFLGKESPVALGDYIAGPSHVLPTGSSARFSSGLSVKDFYKWSSVIERKKKNISSILNAASTLAEAESLEYHTLSLKES